MPRYTLDIIRKRVAAFPRVDLIHRPTPFRKLSNLTAALDGPSIYVKRDDLTGLAFGGNKSRKLEFIIGDLLDKRADVVITWGSVQSNWCLQTAAAAREFGVRPVLVLFRPPSAAPGCDGNLLLDYILEADIRYREGGAGKSAEPAEALAVLEEVAREFRAEGHRPYLVAVGGSLPRGSMDKPLGAVSYVEAFAEMAAQAEAAGVRVDAIVHATGSGGTQAGLAVGAKALAEGCRVVGISVSDPAGPFSKDVLEIGRAAQSALGLGSDFGPEDVIVLDDYIRDGYGVVNKEVAEVIRLVFGLEGIVLDPVYTAKAAVGLIDLIKKGHFKRSDNIVFFHTGGTPALFPNRELIVKLLAKA